MDSSNKQYTRTLEFQAFVQTKNYCAFDDSDFHPSTYDVQHQQFIEESIACGYILPKVNYNNFFIM